MRPDGGPKDRARFEADGLARNQMLLLAALSALGSLGIHSFVPAMPEVSARLGTSPAMVQLGISLYMAGLAGGQLFGGWASDLLGRRPVLIAGSLLYVAASVVCGLASDISILLAARVAQGMGGACALVVSRAVIADVSKDEDTANRLASMALITLLAPTLAPFLGGLVVGYGGWRTLFFVLAGLGVLSLFGLLKGLPESNRQEDRLATGPFAAFPVLLRNLAFLRFAGANAVGTIGMFAFLSGASFLLVERYRFSIQLAGLTFLLVALSVMLGTLWSRRVESRATGRGFPLGSLFFAAGGVSMLLLAMLLDHPAVLVAPMLACGIGAGLMGPSNLAGALRAEPHYRGTASSLFGASQMAVGAVATALVAAVSQPTIVAVAVPVALSGLALLPLAFGPAVLRRRRGG